MSCNSWQPWTTALGSVTQDETKWFDAEGLASVKVQVVASNLTLGDRLYIETTDTPNGAWIQCLTLAPVNTTDPSFSVARTLIRGLPNNNPAKLHRYLRWRLEGGSVPVTVTPDTFVVPNRVGFRVDLAMPCTEEV